MEPLANWTKTCVIHNKDTVARGEFEICTDLSINTTVAQRPWITCFLTHGTHDGGVGFTNLLTDGTTNQQQLGTHKFTMRRNGLQVELTDLTWLESIVKRP